METVNRFCDECGAANPREATRCFACTRPLDTSSPERSRGKVREQPAPDEQQAAAPVYMQITLSANAQTTVKLIQPRPEPIVQLLHNRYQILSQVGTGGFGAVYKARDMQAHGRMVAIKAIELDTLSAAQAIEATDTFNRELSLLSNLNHSHLPTIHEHFIDETHWYLVMDFIDGEPLDEYLQQSQQSYLPLKQVLAIGNQLCDVLRYLHQLKPAVIFRDLKPGNIMYTPGGRIYLIDFGIARRFKPGQTRDTTPLGSPGFASPEQYGKAQTTPRSDIYSLGATLYFLLTGYDPSTTPFHLPPIDTLCPTLPEPLARLITSMLALDPADRPADIAAVQQVLNNYSPSTRHTRVLAQTQAYTASQQPVPPPVPTPTPAQKMRDLLKGLFPLIITCMVVVACSLTSNLMGAIAFQRSAPAAVSNPAAVPSVFRLPYIGQITSLDPFTSTDPQAINLENLLFARLVSIDYNGRLVPGIAASWAVSPDELEWTFHINSSSTFNNNIPLSADDIAASLNYALASPSAPATCPFFSLVKGAEQLQTHHLSTLIGTGIRVLDAQTLSISLTHAAPYLPYAIAAPCGSILQKADLPLVAHPLSDEFTHLAFSSTYALDSYVNEEQMTTLTLTYRGKNFSKQIMPGQVPAQIIVQGYPDAEASYSAYQWQQLDMSPAPTSVYPNAENFRTPQPLTLHYYAMNFLARPFNNLDIRTAFALALDKSALLAPYSSPVSALLGPWQSPNDTLEQLFPAHGDPDRAKTSMATALHNLGLTSVDQLPPITFSYQDGQPGLAAEVAKAQLMWLHVLGIKVKLRPVHDLQRAIAATRGNASLQFWVADYMQPNLSAYATLALPFMAGSPWNTVNYGQTDKQKLLQQSLLAFSSSPAFQQVYDEDLAADVAWLPIYRLSHPYLLSFGFPRPFSQTWSPWGSDEYCLIQTTC